MRCKALARQVKLYRTPAWPCSLTFNLPDRSLADSLLARYLATSETVYRIIHVPTFTKAYESLWHLDTVPQDSFIVQLKLIMAIGAVTLDETLSHRKEAVHWIYEAKTWLSDPRSKCKPSFQLLQINLLLLIAQGLLNTEADPSWVVMGSILRRAMHFGLHRDPDHLSPMTLFAAETRRRLWNTMLELAVQSSLQSGGAPLITLDDFDARPPSNYDDDDLLAGGTPPPHPSSRYTSSSVSIALRSTLAARLAVAHHLNDAYSSGHFQETLRIDGDLHTACRVMRRTLQGHISQGHLSASDFAVSVAEIIASRYRAALHIPFFAASMDDPTYTHSRRVVVDMSLRLWRTLYNGLASPDESAIVRWARCGSGELRQIAMQSALLIPLEVLGEMREADDVLGGPAPLREDLVAVLNQAVTWARGCIAIGETNIKGFLLSMCIEARVQGLAKPSCAEDEMPLLVLQAAKRATTEGCELLESTLGEMAAAALSEASGRCTPSVGKEDMDMPFSTDDWDTLVSVLRQLGASYSERALLTCRLIDVGGFCAGGGCRSDGVASGEWWRSFVLTVKHCLRTVVNRGIWLYIYKALYGCNIASEFRS